LDFLEITVELAALSAAPAAAAATTTSGVVEYRERMREGLIFQ